MGLEVSYNVPIFVALMALIHGTGILCGMSNIRVPTADLALEPAVHEHLIDVPAPLWVKRVKLGTNEVKIGLGPGNVGYT